MFPPVQAEEMAFAMTLFVSAANGQIFAGRKLLTLQNRHEGQDLFLRLSSDGAVTIDPVQASAALQTRLYQAFLIVWEHYRGEEQQASIAARVLGFYYLMGRSRGAALERWSKPSIDSEETVGLHPAVVVSIATLALQQDGRLDEAKLVRAIEAVASDYPPCGFAGASSHPTLAVHAKEMASLVANHDWSETPLGPISQWPESLRAVADLALACKFPMVVLWSSDLIQIYNDGYRDLMGDKHPAGLGQPTKACWPEVWDMNEPVYARVLQGESVTFEDRLYPLKRYGKLEEAYFTLCYSPLRSSSSIEGVLVTVFETTLRVKADQLH